MADDRETLHRLRPRARPAPRRAPIRCAWCGRYDVGGVWREEDEVPEHFTARRDPGSLSHGICPRCIAELRATGRSA